MVTRRLRSNSALSPPSSSMSPRGNRVTAPCLSFPMLTNGNNNITTCWCGEAGTVSAQHSPGPRERALHTCFLLAFYFSATRCISSSVFLFISAWRHRCPPSLLPDWVAAGLLAPEPVPMLSLHPPPLPDHPCGEAGTCQRPHN